MLSNDRNEFPCERCPTICFSQEYLCKHMKKFHAKKNNKPKVPKISNSYESASNNTSVNNFENYACSYSKNKAVSKNYSQVIPECKNIYSVSSSYQGLSENANSQQWPNNPQFANYSNKGNSRSPNLRQKKDFQSTKPQKEKGNQSIEPHKRQVYQLTDHGFNYQINKSSISYKNSQVAPELNCIFPDKCDFPSLSEEGNFRKYKNESKSADRLSNSGRKHLNSRYGNCPQSTNPQKGNGFQSPEFQQKNNPQITELHLGNDPQSSEFQQENSPQTPELQLENDPQSSELDQKNGPNSPKPQLRNGPNSSDPNMVRSDPRLSDPHMGSGPRLSSSHLVNDYQPVESQQANDYQPVEPQQANDYHPVEPQQANDYQPVEPQRANNYQPMEPQGTNEYQSLNIQEVNLSRPADCHIETDEWSYGQDISLPLHADFQQLHVCEWPLVNDQQINNFQLSYLQYGNVSFWNKPHYIENGLYVNHQFDHLFKKPLWK
jgi:hypothetical protein